MLFQSTAHRSKEGVHVRASHGCCTGRMKLLAYPADQKAEMMAVGTQLTFPFSPIYSVRVSQPIG